MKGSPPGVHLIDRSGDPEVRCSKEGRVRGHPSWSPDGKRAAFAAEVDGVPTLFSIGADGKDLRRHTTGKEGAEDPAWAASR